MMKKTQKLILMFENKRVETTVAGIDKKLIPLAEKLYDETARMAVGWSWCTLLRINDD